MISFKNAAHAFATFLKNAATAVEKDAPKVIADLEKAEATKTEVEITTGAILSAVNPAAAATGVGIEDAAYAVLGELVSLINAGGSAAEAKLANAGLDQSVITAAKNVAAGASQVATLVKSAK